MTYPEYLRPAGQIFHWRRIEHVDGKVRDWPSLILSDAQKSNMTAVEIGWYEYFNELGVYYWAAGIHEGTIHGIAVRQIVAEWDGPIDSGPPMAEAV